MLTGGLISRLLASQQQQLLTNESYVLLGEMSSAIAHSLRNPFAAIRSSAELALEVAGPKALKNIHDIIDQVDRMSHWVRDLLLSSQCHQLKPPMPQKASSPGFGLTAAIDFHCTPSVCLVGQRC